MWIYYFSIFALVGLFGVQLFKRQTAVFFKFTKIFSVVSTTVIAGLLVYYSYAQYFGWMQSELTSYLLPPHRSFGYFFTYLLGRFWAQYLVSLIAGIVFFFIAKHYNQKHEERFFHKEEPYIIGVCLFLVGHPLWIFYLFAAVVLYAVVTSIHNGLAHKKRMPEEKSEVRTSFYFGWIPTALFVILLKKFLLNFPPLYVLIFSTSHFLL